jgi:hypothetical protein
MIQAQHEVTLHNFHFFDYSDPTKIIYVPVKAGGKNYSPTNKKELCIRENNNIFSSSIFLPVAVYPGKGYGPGYWLRPDVLTETELRDIYFPPELLATISLLGLPLEELYDINNLNKQRTV